MNKGDIIIFDQMYGAIAIPVWLHPVVFSPELQRLREVRLINTTSPSCAALSDARRFTHTLGVLHLASRLAKTIIRTWSLEEGRAFLVAALLHDVGTPAFGHLFEYQLASMKGWNHEKFVLDIIRGTYRFEKDYQHIYYNNPLSLHRVLERIGVDIETVVDMVNGRNALGKLLAGFIDLDNIDNVYRMAALLGLQPDFTEPVQLVDAILPTKDGPVFEKDAFPLLKSWQELRRRDYEILAFDEYCLSSQAMLTDCLTIALTRDILGERHWYYTDEQLLRELLKEEATKEIIRRFAVGDYYTQVFLGWYSCPKGEVDLRHPDHRTKLVEQIKKETNILCSPYVFYDSGTFSKKLTLRFNVRSESKLMELGEKSQSTIVSVFTHLKSLSSSERKKLGHAITEIMESYGLYQSCLKPIPDKRNTYEIPGQRAIPF